MNIVSKVMEKSWKFVGKNVYEPCFLDPLLEANMYLFLYK